MKFALRGWGDFELGIYFCHGEEQSDDAIQFLLRDLGLLRATALAMTVMGSRIALMKNKPLGEET